MLHTEDYNMYKKLQAKLQKLFHKETKKERFQKILEKLQKKLEKLEKSKSKKDVDTKEEIIIIEIIIEKIHNKLKQEK